MGWAFTQDGLSQGPTYGLHLERYDLNMRGGARV